MYRRRILSGLDSFPPRRQFSSREQAQLDELWAMSADERVAAMRGGRLSLFQLCRWTSRYPEQVPLLGGEFEWITVKTPEWADSATDERSA